MAVTDDAFELVRDLAELKQIAADSGNTDLQALAVRISERTSHLSRKLTELLEEQDEAKIQDDKKYNRRLADAMKKIDPTAGMPF